MYGKIYDSMFTGSLVGTGALKFALMTYAAVHAKPDEDDSVDLHPVALSAIFGESIDDVKSAINFLCSPDPDSRSTIENGRRLIKTGPGPFRYKVVNASKYRSRIDDRSEYWRQYRAWQRGGKKGEFKFIVNTKPVHSERSERTVNTVNLCEQFTHTEASVSVSVPGTSSKIGTLGGTGGTKESLTKPVVATERFKKPTLEELKLQAAKIGLPEDQCIHFMNHYEANGWKVGKNPMRSWSHALSNWHLNYRNCTYRKPTPNGTELLTTEAKIREIQQIVKRATV